MWARIYRRISQRRLLIEHFPGRVFPEPGSPQESALPPDSVYFSEYQYPQEIPWWQDELNPWKTSPPGKSAPISSTMYHHSYCRIRNEATIMFLGSPRTAAYRWSTIGMQCDGTCITKGCDVNKIREDSEDCWIFSTRKNQDRAHGWARDDVDSVGCL